MKERKHMDELNVAKRFISIYNRTNGTDFADPYKPQDDDSLDAQSSSSSDPSRKLKMQVTKSDPEPWKYLREQKYFDRSEAGSEGVFNRLFTAINKKSEKYPPKLKRETILLLDGWWGVLKEEVEVFKTQYGGLVRATGFAEIWFVGLSEDTIIRIA